MSHTPTLSIVIEWENARFADLLDTKKMLRELKLQLAEVDTSRKLPEVIFLYDRLKIDDELIRDVLEKEFPASEIIANIRVVPTEGLGYYQQKNFGARLAQGEIVIFLDCDVTPEPGWLLHLLSAFDDPDVSVALGQTFIKHDSIYSKAFALFWFFELRETSNALCRATSYQANNLGFRRDIILSHPFPELPTTRAGFTMLVKSLRGNGIEVYKQMGACVSHPPPNGLWHFIVRALHNGRDSVLVTQLGGHANRIKFRWAYWDFVSNIKRTLRRFSRRREVGLGPTQTVLAFGIALFYFLIAALGGLLTAANRDLVPRMFPA